VTSIFKSSIHDDNSTTAHRHESELEAKSSPKFRVDLNEYIEQIANKDNEKEESITQISITGYEDNYKGQLESVIYIIEYIKNDVVIYTKRSTEEFIGFLKAIQEEYPNLTFPYVTHNYDIMKEVSEKEIIQNRQLEFNRILNFVL